MTDAAVEAKPESTKTILLVANSNGAVSNIDWGVEVKSTSSFSNINNPPPSSKILYLLTLPPAPPSIISLVSVIEPVSSKFLAVNGILKAA